MNALLKPLLVGLAVATGLAVLIAIAWSLLGVAGQHGPRVPPSTTPLPTAVEAAKTSTQRPETKKTKAFRELASEHIGESARLRGVPPDERSRRLQPFIERYSALCQDARDEPMVQFECLRALAGLYATTGDAAAAAGVNNRMLALEPAVAAASGRSPAELHKSSELYRINGLELLAELALTKPDDMAAQQRLADFLVQQPDVFQAGDLAMLDAAASKALLACTTTGRNPQALAICDGMLQAILGERPAAADGAAAFTPDPGRWLEAAIAAAVALKRQDRIDGLLALAAAHPGQLKRGSSYYAVLPYAAGSHDFAVAARRALERGPADAFTPELMLRLAQAELKQEDYPAAAHVLAELERLSPFDPNRPEQRNLKLEALFAQGEAFQRMDQREQANAYWDRFITLAEPGDPRTLLIRSIRGTR